jgi:hypothetical protein
MSTAYFSCHPWSAATATLTDLPIFSPNLPARGRSSRADPCSREESVAPYSSATQEVVLANP